MRQAMDCAARESLSATRVVEKEYAFDTEDGRKTLAELFDGRSQLLAYNVMFGPDYELGAARTAPASPVDSIRARHDLARSTW
ncbi:MAG TPA: DUF899 family protein [Solirubrobacterales bacterium]|jgi:predicted dithiol-disulfide oxidoreductase (DUF899 family)